MEPTSVIQPTHRVEGPIAIANFVLEKEIGRGGMSRVYLGRQIEPRRKVAIKVVSPQSTDDPSFLQALKEEGDTIAGLSHDNIVTVYSCGVVDHHYYLAMEILSGGDLSARIKRGMTPEETIEVMIQVGGALGHAHSRGILHRDIKPENIMFHENGKAVLVDFGIAKETDTESNFTRVGAVVGTPHYMAPERAMGKSVDLRSDLYALGVMFYEMLTGRKVFEGKDTFAVTYAHVYEAPSPLPAQFDKYQPVLDKLLAKDPDERFQNAEQMVAALSRFRAPSIHSANFATRTSTGGFQSLSDDAAHALRKPKVYAPLLFLIVALVAFFVWRLWPAPALPLGAEMAVEKRLEMMEKLSAAGAFLRSGMFDSAEDLYIQVLEQYDCNEADARSQLRALNPAKHAEILGRCP